MRESTHQVDLAPWFAGVWLSTSFQPRCESWPSEADSFFPRSAGTLAQATATKPVMLHGFFLSFLYPPTTKLRFLPDTQLSFCVWVLCVCVVVRVWNGTNRGDVVRLYAIFSLRDFPAAILLPNRAKIFSFSNDGALTMRKMKFPLSFRIGWTKEI